MQLTRYFRANAGIAHADFPTLDTASAAPANAMNQDLMSSPVTGFDVQQLGALQT